MRIVDIQCVSLVHPASYVQQLVEELNGIQELYRFSTTPAGPEGIVLLLNEQVQEYVVEIDKGLYTLSLLYAKGVALYANITVAEFVLANVACARLLGRVTQPGSLFRREDFFHRSFPLCVLAFSGAQEHACRTMESLYVCPDCMRFFPTLQADDQLAELREVMNMLDYRRIDRSCRRRRARQSDTDEP